MLTIEELKGVYSGARLLYADSLAAWENCAASHRFYDAVFVRSTGNGWPVQPVYFLETEALLSPDGSRFNFKRARYRDWHPREVNDGALFTHGFGGFNVITAVHLAGYLGAARLDIVGVEEPEPDGCAPLYQYCAGFGLEVLVLAGGGLQSCPRGELTDFYAAVSLGPRILLIGSGPSAAQAAYHAGCRDAVIMNGAPDIPDARVFMALDEHAAAKTDWYRPNRAEIYLLGRPLARIRPPGHQPYYVFDYAPQLKDVVQRDPAVLHCGGTVLTCALQLAMYYRPVEIALIGCEMTRTDEKWNGPDPFTSHAYDGHAECNRLIAEAQRMRIDIHHIGKSTLEVRQS